MDYMNYNTNLDIIIVLKFKSLSYLNIYYLKLN